MQWLAVVMCHNSRKSTANYYCSSLGKMELQGQAGVKRIKGERGGKGSKGIKGEIFQLNWKQCVWTSGDDRNSGKIQAHVHCCSCSTPANIDLIVFKWHTADNPFSTRKTIGYCENLPSGNAVVALHVGRCSRWGNSVDDAHTGLSIYPSRILVTETSAPQQQYLVNIHLLCLSVSCMQYCSTSNCAS